MSFVIERRIPTPADLAQALRAASVTVVERRFAKGGCLFHEGAEAHGFWIVRAGSVNVYTLSPEGRVQILERCEAGDVVGLASAIEGHPMSASASAREDSILAWVGRPDLLRALRAFPEVGLAVAGALASRLLRLSERVASVGLHGVRARLARYLLDAFAAADGTGAGTGARPGAPELALRERQEEIARALGTVREVLARAFRSLRQDGVIEQRRERVRIIDAEALRRIAAA